MLLECVDILKWRQGNNKGLLIEGVGGREGGSGVRTTRRCGPCSPSKQVHVDADAASLDGDQPREPHEETRKKKKRRRRRRSRVPLNPRQFACMKICGQSRCLLFLLWQITIPGKYYPADPVIFGGEGCWTQRHESDAWMRLAGAGRVRGHPGFGPSSGYCTGKCFAGIKEAQGAEEGKCLCESSS